MRMQRCSPPQLHPAPWAVSANPEDSLPRPPNMTGLAPYGQGGKVTFEVKLLKRAVEFVSRSPPDLCGMLRGSSTSPGMFLPSRSRMGGAYLTKRLQGSPI